MPYVDPITGIESPGALGQDLEIMSSNVSIPPGLADQSSPLTITVINQTQFSMSSEGLYFETGRAFTQPYSFGQFRSMSFSVCADDQDFITEHLQGVSGGASFDIDVLGAYDTQFSVGFSNPLLGSIKASVLANSSMNAAYEAIVDSQTTASIGPIDATDTNGDPVTVMFQLVSQSGAETTITVTQQVVNAKAPACTGWC